MNKKIRIAIASYTLNSTQGLSYVAQALLSRFMKRDDFECAFVSVAGENTTEQGLGVWGKDFLPILGKLTIANCQLLSKENVVNFDPFIKEWQPDILISVCDPWMQDQYSYSPYRSSYYWCLYQHIETPEYPEWVMMPTSIVPNVRKSIKNIMQSSDLIIPVTEMGKNTLLKFGYKHVTTPIYNGLDIDKIITKDVLKQYAFGTTVKEEDFIFMTLGVNNERKKLDRTLEAFAKFLNKKGKYRDRYKLYLHAPLDMQQGGTDLKEAIVKLNIGSNVLTISDYQKDVGISKSSLYSKYKACDCFILLTGGEGFGYGYCSPAGTSVLTNKGTQNIEEIKKGDKVITHNGNLKLVEGTTSRYFEDDLYNIKTISNLPLFVTKGHRLFGVKVNKRFTYLTEKDLIPDWYSVETYSKGDLLAIPKIKKDKEEINFIKITDFVDNLVEEDNHVFYKMSKKTNGVNSLNSIAKYCGCTFQTVYKILNSKNFNTKLGEKVRNYCEKINYKTPEPVKCLNKIDLTPDVMEFFGLYIAEGSLSDCSFGICLHEDEKELQELSRRVSKKLFGNVEIDTRIRKNTKSCTVTVSSKVSVELLKNLFGKGALNKKIPFELFNNKNINYLLKGYFKGDGCLVDGITAKTISKNLAYNVYHILNINGIFSGIREQDPYLSFSDKVANKDGVVVGKHKQYTIRIYDQFKDLFFKFVGLDSYKYSENKTTRKQNFIKESDNYFFVPIEKVGKEKVSAKVFNLHIEDDESYVAEGYSSHNCEAIAHGKPVIYTDYGGHPEFCKNFGLSVPVSDYVSAVNGYIKFALADINVAANRMEQISSNKELYKKLSTGGYEFVKTNFDWNIIFQKFLDMLMLNYKNNLENSNKIDFPLKRII